MIAAITGEIDISNARALERRIVDALDPGIAGLVVDLTGLSFLDGSGAHLLYALDDRVNGRFAIVLPDSSRAAPACSELSGPRPAHWMHRSEAEAIAAVLQHSTSRRRRRHHRRSGRAVRHSRWEACWWHRSTRRSRQCCCRPRLTPRHLPSRRHSSSRRNRPWCAWLPPVPASGLPG